MIIRMAKKKNPARTMRETKIGRFDRNLAGRTPTRTAPAYRSSRDVGPGFDEPTFDQGSGYGLTQEEQNAQNYPAITDRMYESQGEFAKNVPFVGKSRNDIREKYVPGRGKRSGVSAFLDSLAD
jgi:hypothetical protein